MAANRYRPRRQVLCINQAGPQAVGGRSSPLGAIDGGGSTYSSDRRVGVNLMRWYRRFFRRGLTEKQLEAELRFHLDQQIADYVAAGMAPEAARRRARLEFGGLEQVKEECREVGAAHFLETLIQDVRYGVRMLRK